MGDLNSFLSYLSAIINPIAFLVGGLLTLQIWGLRKNGRPNPVCLVIAAVLACYQLRNAITALSVWYYSVGLVRPTGLLIYSLIGRMIEIAATVTASLYFAGKLNRKEKKEAC